MVNTENILHQHFIGVRGNESQSSLSLFHPTGVKKKVAHYINVHACIVVVLQYTISSMTPMLVRSSVACLPKLTAVSSSMCALWWNAFIVNMWDYIPLPLNWAFNLFLIYGFHSLIDICIIMSRSLARWNPGEETLSLHWPIDDKFRKQVYLPKLPFLTPKNET